MSPEPQLVHGMGQALVAPHWAPLTQPELARVLSHYPEQPLGTLHPDPGPGHGPGTAEPVEVAWRSPRPTSAAALARRGPLTVFVKRHHVSVRNKAQLGTEHAFAAHLRQAGQPVPQVLSTAAGATVVEEDQFVYEVHALAPGHDLYRHALSWSPFASTGHARAAGAALARFHLASRAFADPARPFGPLVNSTTAIASPDLLDGITQLRASRPGLDRALATRSLATDADAYLAPLARQAAALLAELEPWWGHGDWHASNLMWSAPTPLAEVVGIIDLGLCNRTYAPHDLALAIERNCVDWLDLAGRGQPEADIAAVTALVGGYTEVRALDSPEAWALPVLLPICHVEHALSELEYFTTIAPSPADADLAYDNYLLGHSRWFASRRGQDLIEHLSGFLATAARPAPAARSRPRQPRS